MKKLVGPLLAMALAASGSGTALASTATQSFTVQITLTASCIFSSATGALNFGSAQRVIDSNVDAATTLNVQCTNTTPYNIGLSAGGGSGATFAARKMTGGSATVTYSLYSDSSRTTVWGDTVGSNTVSGTGSGSTQAITVYGRVPAQSTPAPGAYSDTVTATITY
jgi:spore coat protein U-like protein